MLHVETTTPDPESLDKIDFVHNKLEAAIKEPAMLSESKLKVAIDLLIQACQPRRIILFGSQARGDADEDSDIDLMIVEDSIDDVGAEIVRLSRVIGPLLLPADIVVASQKHFDYWRETPGNVYFEAAAEGKVLYEKAS